MYLHPATFEWDPSCFLHEDDQDIGTIQRIPQRGYGRVHLEIVETMEQAILFLTEEEVEMMEEDMFQDETPEFQCLVRSILDYAQTHSSSARGEHTFILTY